MLEDVIPGLEEVPEILAVEQLEPGFGVGDVQDEFVGD